MPIPFNDIAIVNRRLQAEIEAGIRDVLYKGQYDVMPQVTSLEAEMSDFLGGGRHCIGVQSGTTALFLALKALGLGPGDEVITVPNSDLSTTAAISHVGATFVLADVEEETHCIDPEQIEAAIGPRTRAIVPVHMYGHPADMEPIMEIARRRNLMVVEDAALAPGARYHGKLTGTIGPVGCFSFGAGKTIGGAGNAGLVAVADPELATRVKMLRGYGQPPHKQEVPPEEKANLGGKDHWVEGHNLRMDSLQAAVIRPKLRHFWELAEERRAIADYYTRRFTGTPVRPPALRPGCTHSWRNYTVLVEDRDRVREELRRRGIPTLIYFDPPVHLQPVYRHLGLGPGSFPAAERLAQRVLQLPIYPGLAPDQAREVADALLEVVA